jgi:hypothetical protein
LKNGFVGGAEKGAFCGAGSVKVEFGGFGDWRNGLLLDKDEGDAV